LRRLFGSAFINNVVDIETHRHGALVREGNAVPAFVAHEGENVNPDETCQRMARFMPRITELVVDTRDTPADFIASCLVDIYGEQLRVIKSMSPLDLNFPQLSTQLRSLTVAIDYDDGMLFPLVTADTLESLCLYKAPPDFSWRQFWDEKSASKQITFSNLRNLEIEFGTGRLGSSDSFGLNNNGLGNHNHFQLRFPSLRKLSTEFWYISTDIILREFLPESLDYVRIWGFMECVENSLLIIPRHIKTLDIHMDDVEDTELEQFYALTNKIFDMSVADYYSLSFHNSFFHLDIDRINWFSLRKLVVLRVTMEVAVGILEKLTMLEIFQINALDTDEGYINDVWPNSLGDNLPELDPLNSRVSYLGLSCEKDFNSGLQTPQIFYYFMFRLRKLERFYVDNDNNIFCRAFIERHGSQYEHLNNIGVFKKH
ncbi:hypothetical protein IW150_006340, partial [Coemansia sp. RSA 2607]